MGSRGEETPVRPDEPDVLDASYGLQGLGVDGLATGCRVRRVVWWFLRGFGVVVDQGYARVCGGVIPN
jgi:hypothetical protein